ncbi:hypothetical protein PR048_030166 [Dryococelus australis]|uniref:Uncharacterized protein n=1 Tax=Dryococelus australis TaxID=614101 RepID=A0ABQ9G860_9NEOP|nr:hypothetical protein PR048_030166 [Dryococelus australis]
MFGLRSVPVVSVFTLPARGIEQQTAEPQGTASSAHLGTPARELNCHHTCQHNSRGGRGGLVYRLITSHLGEPGSTLGGAAPGFLHVRIVLNDAASRRIFSGISRFPRPCIPALLRNHFASPSSPQRCEESRGGWLADSRTHARDTWSKGVNDSRQLNIAAYGSESFSGRHRNEGVEETGDPRENPPTNGIVRHESLVTRPGFEPSSPWWEASVLIAQPPLPQTTLLHIKLRSLRRKRLEPVHLSPCCRRLRLLDVLAAAVPGTALSWPFLTGRRLADVPTAPPFPGPATNHRAALYRRVVWCVAMPSTVCRLSQIAGVLVSPLNSLLGSRERQLMTRSHHTKIGHNRVDNRNCRRNDNFVVSVAKKASCRIGIVRPRVEDQLLFPTVSRNRHSYAAGTEQEARAVLRYAVVDTLFGISRATYVPTMTLVYSLFKSNTAQINELFTVMRPNRVQFSQKGRGFISMQQPMEKRRRLQYIQIVARGGGRILAALNVKFSRADEGEVMRVWSRAPECKGEGNGRSPGPAAKPGTIPTCENSGLTPPGFEPGSPWREAKALAAVTAAASKLS